MYVARPLGQGVVYGRVDEFHDGACVLRNLLYRKDVFAIVIAHAQCLDVKTLSRLPEYLPGAASPCKDLFHLSERRDRESAFFAFFFFYEPLYVVQGQYIRRVGGNYEAYALAAKRHDLGLVEYLVRNGVKEGL